MAKKDPTAPPPSDVVTPAATPPRKGKYGKGWKPNTKEMNDKTLKAKGFFGAHFTSYPDSFMGLEPHVAIWDQQQTSCCVGFATAQATNARCGYMGTPIPRPSPVSVYTPARAYDRPNASTSLQDEGCFPSNAMRGITEYGIASNAAWPFSEATINAEPTAGQLENASIMELSGHWHIDSEGADRITDVCQALSQGYPVILGVQVDQAFENYDGTGVLTAPADNGGGHMLCIVGYRTVNGKKQFRGVNSWGTSWGDRGFFWADEAWLTDAGAGDLNVMAVSSTGKGQ